MTTKATLNEQGHEVLSDVPLALPMGFKTPETLAQQVARLVRSERWKTDMENSGAETFEEANDFDVPDDEHPPFAAHETVFDPILQMDVTAAEFHENQAEYKRLFEAEAKTAIPDPAPVAPVEKTAENTAE